MAVSVTFVILTRLLPLLSSSVAQLLLQVGLGRARRNVSHIFELYFCIDRVTHGQCSVSE
jgi:hypothetical protein